MAFGNFVAVRAVEVLLDWGRGQSRLCCYTNFLDRGVVPRMDMIFSGSQTKPAVMCSAAKELIGIFAK